MKTIQYDDRVETVNSNNELHSFNDKPAIVYNNGNLYYCNNGKIHRNYDKPAVIDADGTKCWYKEGKLHRLRGPAIEWSDGEKEWWYDDQQVQHR